MATTLEQLVGAMLVVGLPDQRLSAESAAHLRAIRAGGFIPFARNFSSPDQFRLLLDDLAEALGDRPWVMVDHEGGRVVRFASGVTAFPDALTVGRSRQPDDARRQGGIEATELRALGVHVNLAPCVDVLMEGADPIIGTRSYGSDPRRVAAMSAARIQGLQSGGALACAKHFPGIGAAPNDPHKRLPTIPLGWGAMRATHLAPFLDAIRAGVATIMSSHVCYPQLEPSPMTPATFSRRLMTELLRQELGFTGLALTDDLEMGALRELCPIGEAAVRAVEAGHDVLLICSDAALQRQVFEALCAAHRTGRLSRGVLEERAERIAAVRRLPGARAR